MNAPSARSMHFGALVTMALTACMGTEGTSEKCYSEQEFEQLTACPDLGIEDGTAAVTELAEYRQFFGAVLANRDAMRQVEAEIAAELDLLAQTFDLADADPAANGLGEAIDAPLVAGLTVEVSTPPRCTTSMPGAISKAMACDFAWSANEIQPICPTCTTADCDLLCSGPVDLSASPIMPVCAMAGRTHSATSLRCDPAVAVFAYEVAILDPAEIDDVHARMATLRRSFASLAAARQRARILVDASVELRAAATGYVRDDAIERTSNAAVLMKYDLECVAEQLDHVEAALAPDAMRLQDAIQHVDDLEDVLGV